MAEEFNVPKESSITGQEFHIVAEEYSSKPAAKAAPTKSLTQKIRQMVYLVAACGSVASFGFATATISEPSQPSSTVSQEAYAPFPELPYPERNPLVPGYGVINEEYLIAKRDGNVNALWLGSAREGTVEPIKHQSDIYYDEATNTLFLNNAKGIEYIEANLMGNSFTINVTGNCEVGHILTWGFHCGGSIRFEGNGTLTINKDKANPEGILIEGEDSFSVIMFDGNATVDIYGTETAYRVQNTFSCYSTINIPYDNQMLVDALNLADDNTYSWWLSSFNDNDGTHYISSH